jgi:cation diffusion facilitator family transporter
MNSPRLRGLIVLSIAAALITLAMKTIAYLLTDSVGLLSDALESCINLLAAVTAYVTLRYAAMPVDATHTYGHEKIEYFSSGLEGALIVVAGIGTIVAVVARLLAPAPLEQLGLGMAIAVVASVINFFVGRLLIHVGRAQRSIVLEADGQHLMSDVVTSAGVVAGLGVVWLTGWQMLDPLIAICVGLNIGWTGLRLVRRSFDGLMDHALPAEEQEKVRAVVRAQLPAGMLFHALRTREAGARRFADFHLLVPGALSVRAAHDVADQIENELKALFPTLETTIHIEPIEALEAWNDNALAGIEPPSEVKSQR